jgi:hypothetical protein
MPQIKANYYFLLIKEKKNTTCKELVKLTINRIAEEFPLKNFQLQRKKLPD